MDAPRLDYTRDREPALVYETIGGGGGGIDVVFVGPVLTHLELSREEPSVTRVVRRAAALGRVVRYDRRGCGMSDSFHGPYTLADEVDDLLAVLDAVGAERVALVGWLTGGALCCLFAATHPERVSALVLDTCSPRQTWDTDYEWAPTVEERDAIMAAAHDTWGTGIRIAALAPEWSADPAARAWMAKVERNASGPGDVRRLLATLNDVDVRAVLPSIRAPTIAIRRRDDQMLDRRHSEYIAAHVPGARLVEMNGRDAMPFGDGADEWVDLIGEFVTGAPPPVGADRALATLLFTDIVDSTATLERLGDAAWRLLLIEHDKLARRVVAEHRGRLVKSLGDGVFARFDAVPDAIAAAHRLLGEATALGVRLRAGVHLGDCEVVGDDLAGRTVHEAARISSLAAGGEVLVSDAAHGLLAGADLPSEDMGRHVLKGFEAPYRLWRVTARHEHLGGHRTQRSASV